MFLATYHQLIFVVKQKLDVISLGRISFLPLSPYMLHAAAKAALEKEASECLLPYSDSRQYIGQYMRDLWQREWDLAVLNKLHAIKPTIGGQSFTYRSRKEQVILDRLRIGHTRLTHSFLLKGEPPPECTTCECQLTIQHILVDCIEYDFIRPELFGNNTTLKDIFDNVSSDDIIIIWSVASTVSSSLSPTGIHAKAVQGSHL